MSTIDSSNRPDSPVDLSAAPDFRSSARTLFVRDAVNDEWWICSWSGAEVVLTTRELEEFVAHCLGHHPAPECGG